MNKILKPYYREYVKIESEDKEQKVNIRNLKVGDIACFRDCYVTGETYNVSEKFEVSKEWYMDNGMETIEVKYIELEAVNE
jgi:hypothetical protein